MSQPNPAMPATLTIPTPARSTRHHSTELLFREASSGDRVAREALTVRYMPLASRAARRYWNSSLPYENLTQVAKLALVKAIDRFDPDRGRPFEAFAIPTILGELRRYFRDSSWAVHVARRLPRALQGRPRRHRAALVRTRQITNSPAARPLPRCRSHGCCAPSCANASTSQPQPRIRQSPLANALTHVAAGSVRCAAG
jgi:RNA polymerase sigma factor (sigma-70 family)